VTVCLLLEFLRQFSQPSPHTIRLDIPKRLAIYSGRAAIASAASVSKVDMRELVIAESKVPLPGNKTPMTTDTVLERQSVIMAVTKEAHERD